MSKNPNFWHLIPLNPRVKIFFQNSGRVTFFTWLTPNFMQSFRKIEWAVSEIFKDGRTDRLTDGITGRLSDGQGRLLCTPLGSKMLILQLLIDHPSMTFKTYSYPSAVLAITVLLILKIFLILIFFFPSDFEF